MWGFNISATNALDKVVLNYYRCVLSVKATKCNAIVYGECGRFPPHVYLYANVLSYRHRLLTMPAGNIVNSVFDTLCNLYNQGFHTWILRHVTWLYVTILTSMRLATKTWLFQINAHRANQEQLHLWMTRLYKWRLKYNPEYLLVL